MYIVSALEGPLQQQKLVSQIACSDNMDDGNLKWPKMVTWRIQKKIIRQCQVFKEYLYPTGYVSFD